MLMFLPIQNNNKVSSKTSPYYVLAVKNEHFYLGMGWGKLKKLSYTNASSSHCQCLNSERKKKSSQPFLLFSAQSYKHVKTLRTVGFFPKKKGCKIFALLHQIQ